MSSNLPYLFVGNNISYAVFASSLKKAREYVKRSAINQLSYRNLKYVGQTSQPAKGCCIAVPKFLVG